MKGKDEIIRKMIEEFVRIIERKGFEYRYIPVTVSEDTLNRQEFKTEESYKYKRNNYMSGSSEQGILERYTNNFVEDSKIYSITPCFREEPYYDENRLKEFLKLELFSFRTYKEDSIKDFYELLYTPFRYYKSKGADVYIKDVTKDEGYHKIKKDIMLNINEGQDLELGSCTFWSKEQSKRFGIKGAEYTVSQTGLSFPRSLRIINKDRRR